MTHTQPWGSTPLLIESSHQIKSSFHFILIFPWWVTVFHFITHFLFDLSSDSSCCYEKELSGIFLWLIDEQIAYWSLKCCLVVLHSLMYIRRLSCLRERTIKFRFQSQLSFFSKILNSTILITASGFVIILIKVSTTLITSLECVHITSAVLGQRKVSEKRSSLEKYVENN